MHVATIATCAWPSEVTSIVSREPLNGRIAKNKVAENTRRQHLRAELFYGRLMDSRLTRRSSQVGEKAVQWREEAANNQRMKTQMTSIAAALCVSVISGCASPAARMTKQEEAIRVFSSTPPCQYKDLGVVAANSGSTFWGTEGSYTATISHMKIQAAKMGANAIIVKSSSTSAGSLGGAVNDLLGEAIFCTDDK